MRAWGLAVSGACLASLAVFAIVAAASSSAIDPVATTLLNRAALSATQPAVTGVVPQAGPVAGGNTVVISGTALTGAADVVVDTTDVNTPCPGGPPTGPCFNVDGDTQITVMDFPVHAAGTVDITVQTPGGTSTTSAADAYTFAPVPTVTSVSPTSGPASGGTAVAVTGTDFEGSTFTTSQVTVGGQDVTIACGTAPCFTVNSATSITVDVPAGSAGTVDITVTTPGGTSTTSSGDQYTYVAAPTVTGVTPNAGPLTGGTVVTVTGTGFVNVSVVTVGTTPVSTTCGIAPCYTMISSTQLTVDMPAEAAGVVDITVTGTGGTSTKSSADTYVYAPVPTITGVSPQFGPTVGGNTVVITGTGFKSSNSPNADFTTGRVSNGTTNVTATPCPTTPSAPCYNVDSATQITAEDFPPHAAGAIDITVTTPGGSSATSTADQYTYELLPNVTNAAPKAGPVVGGNTVTLTGTDFTNATRVTVGTTMITTPCPASPCYTVSSATQVNVVMPAEPAATINITVTTPGGTSATGVADTYAYAPIPTITKVNPNHGSIQGGADVTVTGTGFKSGTYYSTPQVSVGSTSITVTPCPGTVTAPCYNVNSATQIFIEDFPAHAAGSVDLTATTVGGASVPSSADRYIYGATFPTVATLSQRDGAQKGGEVVTIGGTNFTGQGFTTSDVIFSGGVVGTTDVPVTNPYPCPSSTTGCFSVVSASQISVFTPAAAASGTVDITVVTDVGTSGISTADQYVFVAPNTYSALSPFRVCDTRPKSPTPQCTGRTLGSKGTIAIQISGGPVPSGARAVVVNVTAVNHSSTRTYLIAFPSGGSVPRASNLNVDGGANLANLVIVQLSAGGGITIFNSVGSVDVIVDVQGYFAAPTGPGMVPGEFHGIAPFRICDTLANTHTACAGATNNPLPGKTWRRVGLAGTASIPSTGAAAAVFNLTATQETTATFLAVTSPNGSDQCPTGQPAFSNLNVRAAQNLPIRVISQLGPHGDICVYNAVGSANFIIDVNGWFGTGSEATAGALFYSVPPTRICDTRTGSGTECAGKPLSKAFIEVIPVAGVIVVPAKGALTPPIAVVANLTGVSGTAGTFFTLYPSDLSRPGTSDLNPSTNDVVANLAIVRIATTGGLLGDVNLYNAAGSINAILDVAGWFQQ
jgi:IPT/TIG domain